MSAPSTIQSRFTQGSLLKHILVMTGSGTAGLMAIFLVDFLSLYYISLLGDDRMTAGVGYATTVLFFAVSVNIGLMIGAVALVSRAIGEGNREKAQRFATSTSVLMFIIATLISVLVLWFLPTILDWFKAEGLPRDVAFRFLWITLPANPLMALGMSFSSILRAVGDAKRSMNVTLFGGLATAALDPLFIFYFGLGTDGAAIATVISRLIFVGVGFMGVVYAHHLLKKPNLREAREDAPALFKIAGPTVLTNIATPFAALFTVSYLSPFGEAAIAANTIIDRLVPVCFGALFALSGSIGAILGQNMGAKNYARVYEALKTAMMVALTYTLIMCIILGLSHKGIIALFGVSGEAARILRFFCLFAVYMWLFIGCLFVANAAFNNLGFPLYSTFFNWGRATLGIIPLAWLGAKYYGPEGVMMGVLVGAVIFGLAAVYTAFRVVKNIGKREEAIAGA